MPRTLNPLPDRDCNSFRAVVRSFSSSQPLSSVSNFFTNSTDSRWPGDWANAKAVPIVAPKQQTASNPKRFFVIRWVPFRGVFDTVGNTCVAQHRMGPHFLEKNKISRKSTISWRNGANHSGPDLHRSMCWITCQPARVVPPRSSTVTCLGVQNLEFDQIKPRGISHPVRHRFRIA